MSQQDEKPAHVHTSDIERSALAAEVMVREADLVYRSMLDVLAAHLHPRGLAMLARYVVTSDAAGQAVTAASPGAPSPDAPVPDPTTRKHAATSTSRASSISTPTFGTPESRMEDRRTEPFKRRFDTEVTTLADSESSGSSWPSHLAGRSTPPVDIHRSVRDIRSAAEPTRTHHTTTALRTRITSPLALSPGHMPDAPFSKAAPLTAEGTALPDGRNEGARSSRRAKNDAANGPERHQAQVELAGAPLCLAEPSNEGHGTGRPDLPFPPSGDRQVPYLSGAVARPKPMRAPVRLTAVGPGATDPTPGDKHPDTLSLAMPTGTESDIRPQTFSANSQSSSALTPLRTTALVGDLVRAPSTAPGVLEQQLASRSRHRKANANRSVSRSNQPPIPHMTSSPGVVEEHTLGHEVVPSGPAATLRLAATVIDNGWPQIGVPSAAEHRAAIHHVRAPLQVMESGAVRVSRRISDEPQANMMDSVVPERPPRNSRNRPDDVPSIRLPAYGRESVVAPAGETPLDVDSRPRLSPARASLSPTTSRIPVRGEMAAAAARSNLDAYTLAVLSDIQLERRMLSILINEARREGLEV